MSSRGELFASNMDTICATATFSYAPPLRLLLLLLLRYEKKRLRDVHAFSHVPTPACTSCIPPPLIRTMGGDQVVPVFNNKQRTLPPEVKLPSDPVDQVLAV